MTRRKVTLEEMHELQLHMLDCIHAYCTENNIRYSLGGGTLLGAIRHKGFIPWDDDVDIMMPRLDYERFLKGFYGKYEHCTLQNYKTTPYYILPFAKVYDDRTELREGSMISGVYIDVFPIDGMGEERNLDQYYNRLGKLIWKRHLFHAPWYQLDFKLKIYRLFYHSRMRVMKNIDKYTSFFDFETSECTGCAVGRYGRKEQMGCDTFKHYIDVPFEGRTYRAIADYDAYLTKHYGDYMILPPECERKGGHAITSWWKK